MLSEAHTEKNKYYDIRRAELETAKKQIQRRQRNLFDKYMDNDGSNIVGITQEFYDENMLRYAEKLTEIERQQQRLDSMDQGYYVTVEYLLNLFERAADIFKVANSNEKRRILSMLLSNLEFDGKNLVCTLKEPLGGLFLKKTKFGMAGATGIEPISTVLETAILTVVLRPYNIYYSRCGRVWGGVKLLWGATAKIFPARGKI